MVHISNNTIRVFINQQGFAFSDPFVYDDIPTPIPGTIRAVDMYGKGMSGLLYNRMRSGEAGYVYFRIDQLMPPFLLQEIDNGIGIHSQIQYTPVADVALTDEATSRSPETFIPFTLWVVSATLEIDPIRNTTQVVNYHYREGLFDPQLRRFQSFRRVEKTEKGDESRADTLTRYTFHMNQANQPGRTREHAHLDRLLEQVEVYSLDGTPAAALPHHTETTVYDIKVLDAFEYGSNHVFTSKVRKTYQERTRDERIEERTLEYDELGNVSSEVVRGLGTQGGNPVAEKQVVTEVSYARDVDSLISKMARRKKR